MFGDFKLIDLSVLTFDEIKTHKNIALLEGIMQQIYMRDAVNLAHYFAAIAYSAQGLHPQGRDVIEYVLSVKKSGYFKEFFKAFKEIPNGDREVIMTLEEFFIEEGRGLGIEQGIEQGIERGIEQGKHAEALKIARKMVDAGIKVDFIKEVTELNDQDLEPLLRSH